MPLAYLVRFLIIHRGIQVLQIYLYNMAKLILFKPVNGNMKYDRFILLLWENIFCRYVYFCIPCNCSEDIKPFPPLFFKWMFPLLNLDKFIVAYKDVSQKVKQNGKQCRPRRDGSL